MSRTQTIWILALATALHMGSCGPHSRPSQLCTGGTSCSTTEAPFDNADFPLSDIKFRLFTKTCENGSSLYAGDSGFKSNCSFNSSLPLKIVVHGFWQNGKAQWIQDMTAALLQKEPMSVITVDWGSGSGFPYHQATVNARVVGAETSRLINCLRAHAGVSVDKVHIIGHSLGAHIAGYVGKTVPGITRITGLDPAEYMYKDTDPRVHLEKSDAQFVDIIHSDGSEYDWVSVTIDIIFHYVKPNAQAFYKLFCSHSRSIHLFIESINTDCPFYGHPCDSISDLDSNKGNCLSCPRGVCPEMGYNADKTLARGKFYLRTRASSPFCGYTQHVEVEFGSMPSTTGQITVEMIGHDETSDSVVIGSGSDPFVSENQRHLLVVLREPLDDVKEVHVTFTQPWSISDLAYLFRSRKTTPEFVTIKKVTVTSAENGRRIHFCGFHRTFIESNSVTLTSSTTDPNECLHVLPAPAANMYTGESTVEMYTQESTTESTVQQSTFDKTTQELTTDSTVQQSALDKKTQELTIETKTQESSAIWFWK
ncbi:pancreatic triacylglycerol lipase-like [Mercenaria mercenaria]|uniref:pancreatic triacylglycerol lipase-like n=1 Tax=Mercenaria mercenaria TaxID=6596 RepID=UPI00234F529C|nr:pancreatic triacylglycerol lipase-like [Mercenaria mercenaria]